MKKGIGKVSIFMIAAAMGLSVAACTPQDEKGGRKTQTETTVQPKVSKEKAKKSGEDKKEEKNAKAEESAKETEESEGAAKDSGADQTQSFGDRFQGPGGQ